MCSKMFRSFCTTIRFRRNSSSAPTDYLSGNDDDDDDDFQKVLRWQNSVQHLADLDQTLSKKLTSKDFQVFKFQHCLKFSLSVMQSCDDRGERDDISSSLESFKSEHVNNQDLKNEDCLSGHRVTFVDDLIQTFEDRRKEHPSMSVRRALLTFGTDAAEKALFFNELNIVRDYIDRGFVTYYVQANDSRQDFFHRQIIKLNLCRELMLRQPPSNRKTEKRARRILLGVKTAGQFLTKSVSKASQSISGGRSK
eukprot:Selendium_serpulae@DN6686_c0_g1_i1.p1